MSAQSKEWWASLAERIEVDLPSDLQYAAHWGTDQKDEYLLLDFPNVKLDKNDYPKMFQVAKKYRGDFCNRKEAGYDCPYWRFPQPQSDSSPCEPKPLGAQPADSTEKGAKTEPSKPTPQPQQEQPKQPSPLKQFETRYCDICEENGVGCDYVSLQQCIQILKLQELQTLNAHLEKMANRPTFTRKPQKELPKERHSDGGVSWLYDVNRESKQYEKALQAENNTSEYQTLKTMLTDAVSAGKKGLEIEGKWYFLGFDKTWIGRKEPRDFSKEADR